MHKNFAILLFHNGNIVTLVDEPFNTPLGIAFPEWKFVSEYSFAKYVSAAVLNFFDIAIKNVRQPFYEVHSNGNVVHYIAAEISEDDKNIDLWNKANNVQLNVRNSGVLVEMMPISSYVEKAEKFKRQSRDHLTAIDVAEMLFEEMANV